MAGSYKKKTSCDAVRPTKLVMTSFIVPLWKEVRVAVVLGGVLIWPPVRPIAKGVLDEPLGPIGWSGADTAGSGRAGSPAHPDRRRNDARRSHCRCPSTRVPPTRPLGELGHGALGGGSHRHRPLAGEELPLGEARRILSAHTCGSYRSPFLERPVRAKTTHSQNLRGNGPVLGSAVPRGPASPGTLPRVPSECLSAEGPRCFGPVGGA